MFEKWSNPRATDRVNDAQRVQGLTRVESRVLFIECPDCGRFGQSIIYGLVLDPPAHVAIGGCGVTFDDPDYVCECGCGWSVTAQGRIHKPGGIGFKFVLPETRESATISSTNNQEVDELNYDLDDPDPYGTSAWEVLDSYINELLEGAGINNWDEERTDQETELRIRYWGRDRYAMEQYLASEAIMDAQRDAWFEMDQ